MLREVATVLRQTADAFDFLPLQKRSALRAIYAKNLARLHKMEERPAKPVQEEGGMLQRIRACTCPI